MCGIAGIVGSVESGRLVRMLDAMIHRGPDDQGTHVESAVHLGMRRLAVIDTSARGHQPMSNRDGSIWIVYNGEMYNFKEQRKELEARGVAFDSDSDTEVVLRLFETYGESFLSRIRGMYALAILDKRQGPGSTFLTLARDPLGIKPLLYTETGKNFLFASELKALIASGLINRSVDAESLRQLLSYGSVMQPRTILSNVHALLPGHSLRMRISSRETRIDRFWKLETGRMNLRGKPYPELVEMTRSILDETTEMQMVSDVPVGAFLSGGIDSTALVALMARHSDHKMRTFSVGFESEGADIDESKDAQLAADFIGTEHERVVVTSGDIASEIHRIVRGLDQPTVDGVNSYFVSRAARTAVTVALSGTGGDELFAGYPWFGNAVAFEKRSSFATAHKRMAAGMLRMRAFDGMTIGRHYLDYFRGNDFLGNYSTQHQVFGQEGACRVLSDKFRNSVSTGVHPAREIKAQDELPQAGPVDRISALSLRGYTLNQLMRDIDSVSMWHSLEVRVPFLDEKLTDFALSLPADAKLGKFSNHAKQSELTYLESGAKRILIDAMADLLPPGIANQAKRGFGMPFDSWLKGSLKEILKDALSAESVERRGFFSVEEVERIYREFQDGKASWVKVWLLMIIELWAREVIDPA